MRSPTEVIHRKPHSIIRRYRLIALASVGLGAPLNATPPVDPICGIPGSQAVVQAIRTQQQAARARVPAVRLQDSELPPRLWIEPPGPAESLRLVFHGSRGRTYHVETTSDLGSIQWQPWLSLIAGNDPLDWPENPVNAPEKSRFYRLRRGEPHAPEEWAANFRLLDAQGIARDLYYHTHLTGIVAVAAGSKLSDIAPLAPLLLELNRTHTNRIQTWILLSDPAPVRSNVLTQAKSLGIGFPILLDPHLIAARSLGLTHVGEAALVRSPDFAIAYRGDPLGPGKPGSGQSLLGQALRGAIDDVPFTFLRTPVRDAALAPTSETTPDYAGEIAPAFREYCANCHRPAGVAPFALTNHSVAAKWAPSIKHALLSGQMPPWHADPEYGRFANDLSLPGQVKSALIRWIDAGAPRGSAGDPLAELPPPPAYDRWPDELGEPDALVTIPVQPIKATGSEPYRYIFTRTPNPTNVWLKAAVLRPSNYRAVHHHLVWTGHVGNRGSTDSSTYEPHLAEFVPGFRPFQLPADAGIPLAVSNRITFNLHYTPYGVETNDQPVLALWYHKTRPAKTWVSLLAPGNADFSIPPMARDHPVSAEWVAPKQVTLHRMNPHMHLRGKRAKYEALYPNGQREVLLSVPDYDFNWQIGYTLAEPKVLPAGTRLVFSGAFDNSPQNLANPNPRSQVRWGDQSWMEMFAGFIDFTE